MRETKKTAINAIPLFSIYFLVFDYTGVSDQNHFSFFSVQGPLRLLCYVTNVSYVNICIVYWWVENWFDLIGFFVK